jgi:ATP-binding cassette subfamily B protein
MRAVTRRAVFAERVLTAKRHLRQTGYITFRRGGCPHPPADRFFAPLADSIRPYIKSKGFIFLIKTLAKSLRQYKKATILAPAIVAVEVVFEVLIPMVMAELIDKGITPGDMGEIIRIGLILLAFAAIALTCGVLAGRFAAEASAGFATNIRHDMYVNVQSFSFANIDKFQTGSIITRLTTDVTYVQMAFQMLVRMAVRAPLMIIAAFIAAAAIDVKLSLIFAAFIPVLIIGLYLIQSRAHGIFVRVFDTYDELNDNVGENLSAIRDVKSYVREDYEISKFKRISQTVFKDFSKAEVLLAANNPLMLFCVFGSMLLLAWFGANAVVASGNNEAVGLSTGELTSMFTYTMQIMMSLMILSFVFVMVIISRASAERITELLSEKSDLVNPENPVEVIKDGSIEFENVDFSYSKSADKKVLEGVNISIGSGETVGILGGTGSSKSSLVSLIPRLYDVSSGSVKVGGVDVREYDLKALREDVAVVLQKNVLFSGTVADNIRWGNEDATIDEVKRVCELAQADSFIKGFPDGYDTHIEQGGTNVSGGQKQRLCIARALLKKPKVLILDDSTSAVDTKTDALIRKALSEEIPNTTKIIIAQRVASVENADKIILLDDGKIVAIGSHDELLSSNDIYREVYESQVKGSETE